MQTLPSENRHRIILPNAFRHVEELLHLGFRRWLPHSCLQDWVEGYWSLQHRFAEPQAEKLYPDGGTSITFDFSDSAKLQVRLYTSQELRPQWMTGWTDLLGIRLAPGGAYHLLGIRQALLSPVERTDGVNALNLDIPGLNKLCQQLQENPAHLQPRLLDQWLSHCLRRNAGRPHQSTDLIQRLRYRLASPEPSIADLSENEGLSRRRLERIFTEQIGLPPNEFRQLQRIKLARYLIKTVPQIRLTDIAQHCGYFDQAHFNHQFSASAHCTPGEYRRRQRTRLKHQEMRIVKPLLT